jgi:hypothetical protein
MFGPVQYKVSKARSFIQDFEREDKHGDNVQDQGDLRDKGVLGLGIKLSAAKRDCAPAKEPYASPKAHR